MIVKCLVCELIFAFIKKLETSGNEYFSDRARLTGRRDIFEGLKVDLIRMFGCFCCSVIKKKYFPDPESSFRQVHCQARVLVQDPRES